MEIILIVGVIVVGGMCSIVRPGDADVIAKTRKNERDIWHKALFGRKP